MVRIWVLSGRGEERGKGNKRGGNVRVLRGVVDKLEDMEEGLREVERRALGRSVE